MSFDPETLARPPVQSTAPYQAGASTEEIARKYHIPLDQIIKLGSNENPFGMSPKATEAAKKALTEGSRYPDNHLLLQALSTHHSVTTDQIVIGDGSTEVIDMIARTFLGPDDEAISSQYAFAMFSIFTQLAGAKNMVAQAKNSAYDLNAMLPLITQKTRVIWIASPNNPTGTFIPYNELKSFLEKVPDNVLVVVDEAYHDYLDAEHRQDATTWMAEHPNLILLRTFSKIYGLAGLRIGYGIMNERVASLVNRVKQPLNINTVGLAAATAALEDSDFTTMSYQKNKEGLAQLKEGLDKIGLKYLPTYGNFITVQVKNAGSLTNDTLLKHGIIARPLTAYNMPDHLRITVGKYAENSRILEQLGALLQS